MTIRFACGHLVQVSHSVSEKPICACGETRIARVGAPAPSIRGVCSGPLVTQQNLAPATVNLCVDGAKPLPVPIDPSIETKPTSRGYHRH